MMAPNHHFAMNTLTMEPVSRTYQYRKIMKPMLERKRRARINKCLEELKDLMTGTLQADGENISKLEKADILELTVRHLHRLRDSNALFVRSEPVNMDKFWAGFHHCATEVSQFLTKYDRHISGDLLKHISTVMPNIAAAQYQRYHHHLQQQMPSTSNVLYPIQSTCSNSATPTKSLPNKKEPESDVPAVTATTNVVGNVWRPW